jgi:spermidine synthase
VGSSLETWTGIIGTVLAGFAVGDAVGGRLADRIPSPRLLAAILFLAGASVILILPLSSTLQSAWLARQVMLRVVLIAAAVLFAPCALLGAVLPIATRLSLRTIEGAGRTVGWLGAVGTASNVLGVALGGFLFIERFGVRAIVLASGSGLAVLALIPLLAARPAAPARSGPSVRERSAGSKVDGPRLWIPSLVPALSGASIMAVELAGTRIVAPLFGASLYIWAGVIGVILLGISVGNALGGWLADRDPSRRLLGNMFILAGGATLGVLAMPVIYSQTWPGLTRVVLSSLPPALSLPLLLGAMLLAPSILFGTISPIVIRLSLREIGASGGLIGRVYAAQAIGSVAATFATGFVLISHLGARAVILLVAESALLIGVLVGDPHLRRSLQPVVKGLIASVFALALVASLAGWVPSPCLRESNYYCIRVLERGKNIRILALESLFHSYVNLADPTILLYEYEQGFALLVADYAASLRETAGQPPGIPAMRLLFIGGGGYVFPRYIHRVYPASTLEVVEIDPAVTQVAYEALGLPRSIPIRTYNEDGRQFFLRRPQQVYDLVFGDTYRDAYSAPYHLTTVEFARMVADSLKPGGVYAVNIVDGRSGLFVRSYVRTLRQVFRHVSLMPAGRDWEEEVQTTFVVLASQRRLDIERIALRRPRGVPATIDLVALSQEELSRYVSAGRSIVLTDDRAPVDNFLARVYAAILRERRD